MAMPVLNGLITNDKGIMLASLARQAPWGKEVQQTQASKPLTMEVEAPIHGHLHRYILRTIKREILGN